MYATVCVQVQQFNLEDLMPRLNSLRKPIDRENMTAERQIQSQRVFDTGIQLFEGHSSPEFASWEGWLAPAQGAMPLNIKVTTQAVEILRIE